MQSSDWNISTKHIGVERVRWRVYSVTLSRSLSYQGCEPGLSAFKAHAFCFLPWPETSPSIFLNFSFALRTSFQNPLETMLAFQRDTNNYLLREKLLDLHALAQTLSVPWLFNLEGINGLERARTCFPGGEKPGHTSASLSSQPHFFSVTSSSSPQAGMGQLQGEQGFSAPSRGSSPFLVELRSGPYFVSSSSTEQGGGFGLVWFLTELSTIGLFRRYSWVSVHTPLDFTSTWKLTGKVSWNNWVWAALPSEP